jgi:hypothetical protein
MSSDRKIVCAALRNSSGVVLLGIRHYSTDMYEQMRLRLDGDSFFHRSGEDQGFVDQYGKYHTRAEAYIVANSAGQIINDKACSERDGIKFLYSEGLY